jgi:hypothetical protein
MKARMRILESNGHGKILDMGFDYRIIRLSDQKEIAISSSRKSAPLQPDSDGEIWLRTIQNQISS